MEAPRPKGLSIGAVTQITGIAADTLRTWERRYAVVTPLRDEAERRVYTEAQVQRLRTISALAERGERVADLAGLTDDALAERLRLHRPTERAATVRAIVIHPTLGAALDGRLPALGLTLQVLVHATAIAAIHAAPGPIDVLVIDLDTLGPAPGPALDAVRAQLDPASVVLTHGFLARPLRERLTKPGVRLVQNPIPTDSLRETVLEHALLHTRAAPPPAAPRPRDVVLGPIAFTTTRLQQLIDSRPTLACECPNHIASIVLQLRSFEAYSRTCANASPADAAVHAALAEGTAQAATQMEALLRQVLAHEGLSG